MVPVQVRSKREPREDGHEQDRGQDHEPPERFDASNKKENDVCETEGEKRRDGDCGPAPVYRPGLGLGTVHTTCRMETAKKGPMFEWRMGGRTTTLGAVEGRYGIDELPADPHHLTWEAAWVAVER